MSSSLSSEDTAIEMDPSDCEMSSVRTDGRASAAHLDLGAMIRGDVSSPVSAPVIPAPVHQMPIRGPAPVANQQSSVVQPHVSFASMARAGQARQEQSISQQRMDSLFRLMEEQDKHSIHIVCPYKEGIVYSRDQVLQAIESAGVNRKAIQALGQMERNRIWEVMFLDKRSRDVLAQQASFFIGGTEAKVFPTVGDVAAIRVFWAPLCVPTELIAEAIQEETQHRGGSIRFLNASFLNDKSGIATSNRFFKAELEHRDRVPHLIDVRIPGRGRTYRLLVTVQGRDPMCLKCKQVGHHRAACTHSMTDARWCRICERNSGHATVDCPDYTDYTSYAQREPENRDEDPTPQDNLQPPRDSISSSSASTTSVTPTFNASTSASTSTSSVSTTSTSSSASTQSSTTSASTTPIPSASTLISSRLNSVASVSSVVPVSTVNMASSVITVPVASTVTTSSMGVRSSPSTSEMVISSQNSSDKAIAPSKDVSLASAASEMDSLSQFLPTKRGKRKKHKDSREKQQKRATIYKKHDLWTMAGQSPPKAHRDERYEAEQPGDDEFSSD